MGYKVLGIIGFTFLSLTLPGILKCILEEDRSFYIVQLLCFAIAVGLVSTYFILGV